jgi:4-amino-4-deoxy-L-arabinose transferase-like glycosyltransferase
MVFAGRCVAIVLACAVSLASYVLARRLFTPLVALAVTGLCVFDPNLAAHGRLVTTDIGATLAYLLVALALSNWLSCPSRRALLLLSLATGLACLFKHSGLLLVPCGVGCLAWVGVRSESSFMEVIAAGLMFILGIALVIWLGYGCESVDPVSQRFFPLASYLHGVATQWSHARSGQPSYLLGQFSTQGWWYFYPAIFLMKTPVGTLFLLLIGVLHLIRDRARWRVMVPVLFPAMALLAALVFMGRAAVGYRHLLPALPLLLICLGGTAIRALAVHGHLGKAIIAGSMIWLLAAHGFIWPHYLAYFNELVGGPGNGHLCAVDSNLDWGQDLPLVTEYVRRYPNGPVGLVYFGSALLPELLAVPAIPIDKWADAVPERVAVSATALHGVSSGGRLNLWPLFADQQPLDMLGWSILVYKTPDSWRQQHAGSEENPNRGGER